MQIFLFCVFISVYVFIIFCTFFYFIYLVMRRSYSCYLSCLLSDSSKTFLFFLFVHRCCEQEYNKFTHVKFKAIFLIQFVTDFGGFEM